MLTKRGKRGPLRRQQHGLSIVELLVGVAVGLFVVAAAALMVSSQLADNRRLLLETQLQQDLRATVDIVTREMRRASYWQESQKALWYETRTSPITANSFGAITPASGENLNLVSFTYRRRSGDEGPYGFKVESQVLKSMIANQWQTLSDVSVVRITDLDIDLAAPVVYQLPCPNLCPDGTQACWPELQLRTATVSITGQSATDPSVQRTVSSRVRLRNDVVRFNGAEVCPG